MRSLNDSLCVGDGLFVDGKIRAVVIHRLIVCDATNDNCE